MAIWQYRLILIPEKILLNQYDVLPLSIPMELAEDLAWWSDVPPQLGFERKIDLILPSRESWSESMRMWGQEHSDDAYVCYVDESKKIVEEISFRVDARTISLEVVQRICRFATDMECVLLTSEHEILAPEEAMVLANINRSTGRGSLKIPSLLCKVWINERCESALTTSPRTRETFLRSKDPERLKGATGSSHEFVPAIWLHANQ